MAIFTQSTAYPRGKQKAPVRGRFVLLLRRPPLGGREVVAEVKPAKAIAGDEPSPLDGIPLLVIEDAGGLQAVEDIEQVLEFGFGQRDDGCIHYSINVARPLKNTRFLFMSVRSIRDLPSLCKKETPKGLAWPYPLRVSRGSEATVRPWPWPVSWR